MALSGTLVANGGYEGRTLVFSWTATQSIPYNNSTISWNLKGGGTNPEHWYSLRNASVVIDGETVYTQGEKIQLRHGDLVASGYKALTHNSDGNRSFTVSIQGAIYEGSINTTGSQTFYLNTLPRQARITSAPNFNQTITPMVTYSNPAGNNAVLDLGIFLTDGMTAIIPYRRVSSTSTYYTYNFTQSEIQSFYNQMPNSKSLRIRFYLKTTLNGTEYLDYAERTFSIASSNITLNPTVEAIDSLTIGLTGSSRTLIAGVSDAQCRFNASTDGGATIVEKTVRNGNLTLNNDGVIYDGTSPNFEFTVKDSRNNTASQTVTTNMIPYFPISCSIGDTMPDTQGHFTLTIIGRCFNGGFGKAANTLTVYYRMKTSGGSWGNWERVTLSEWKTDGSGSYKGMAIFNGLNYQSTYTFQAKAADALTVAETAQRHIKTQPVFDWSKDDVTFNVPVHFKKGGDGLGGGGGSGDYLPISGGTLTGDLRLQKNGQNYGSKLNFGDGDYVYLAESTDDTLDIQGSHVRINNNIVEAGTWTPTVPGTSSYSSQAGSYLRIGNTVCITFTVSGTFGWNTSNSTILKIQGVPFRPVTSAFGGGVCWNGWLDANNYLMGWGINANENWIIGRTGSQSTAAQGCFIGTGLKNNPGSGYSVGGTITFKVANSW